MSHLELGEVWFEGDHGVVRLAGGDADLASSPHVVLPCLQGVCACVCVRVCACVRTRECVMHVCWVLHKLTLHPSYMQVHKLEAVMQFFFLTWGLGEYQEQAISQGVVEHVGTNIIS